MFELIQVLYVHVKTSNGNNVLLRSIARIHQDGYRAIIEQEGRAKFQIYLNSDLAIYTDNSVVSFGSCGQTKVVVKEGLGDRGIRDLTQEAFWGDFLDDKDILPPSLGLFEFHQRADVWGGRVMVSLMWGEALIDFNLVDSSIRFVTIFLLVQSGRPSLIDNDHLRLAIYEKLADLHKLGVQHGDFAPRNVVEDQGEIRLIDLANASKHKCQGRDCRELVDARKELRLD
jgi:hypothetical protein